MSVSNIFEDVLDDTLMLGSLAASIFVKNPASQTTAAKLLNAAATLLAEIHSQLHPTVASATVSASVTPIVSSTATVTTVAQ
jgi:hypothetical protein